jgi:hypothetical protein
MDSSSFGQLRHLQVLKDAAITAYPLGKMLEVQTAAVRTFGRRFAT